MNHNCGLYWTVFTQNRDTAVPAEGNGGLQTLICVLVARPRRCLTLSNPVPWQNWMAAYLGYTLRMKTPFRGWPVMVHDTHTRRLVSQETAFSSADCSWDKPTFSFVRGQDSTMSGSHHKDTDQCLQVAISFSRHRSVPVPEQIQRLSTVSMRSRWSCHHMADNIWLFMYDNYNGVRLCRVCFHWCSDY